MTRLLFPGILALVLCATAQTRAQSAASIPGTYSNLRYIEASGDLLGYEIKIIPVGQRYQGAWFESEGGPEPMVLVDVEVKGDSISFQIPMFNGSKARFKGRVFAKSLIGTFELSGKQERIRLIRRCGYWDC